MSSVIETFIAELRAAAKFEAARVHGYKVLLAFPPSLLGAEARRELDEALVWSVERLRLVERALAEAVVLLGNGYPERVQQQAPSGVVQELLASLADVQLAIDEFQSTQIEAVWGKITVGEEVKA